MPSGSKSRLAREFGEASCRSPATPAPRAGCSRCCCTTTRVPGGIVERLLRGDDVEHVRVGVDARAARPAGDAATLPQSRSPLVCESSCRIGDAACRSRAAPECTCAPGRRARACRRCASSSTAAAVNCFDTEPASKIVSGRFAMPCSRSAMPKARLSTWRPSCEMPSVQPGSAVVSQRLNSSSISMRTFGAIPESAAASRARANGEAAHSSAAPNRNARLFVFIVITAFTPASSKVP